MDFWDGFPPIFRGRIGIVPKTNHIEMPLAYNNVQLLKCPLLAREETRRRETPIVLDDSGVPSGFTFGLLDIVTYPFLFMLAYSVKLDSARIDNHDGGQLWMLNSNMLNHFYPTLRRFTVLTIPHWDEEPIDDAPIHNIVLWPRHQGEAETIRSHLHELTQSGVPTHFVSRSQPIMDDRYALHERRPEDGEPFNLLPLLDVVGRR